MTEEFDFQLISYKLQYMHKALKDAGLLNVISVRLDKTIEWSNTPTPQQVTQANNILSGIDLNTLIDIERNNIIEKYQEAITRLEQIRDSTNPTNAQVIAAVKDIAKYQVILLNFLKRIIV